MDALRIGIVGAQSTGKTTLAELLAKDLNLPLIKEQARVVAQELGVDNVDKLLDRADLIAFQSAIFKQQMSMEIAHINTGTGFVSDRTILDNLVYWKFCCLDDTEDYLLARVKAEMHLAENPYTLVFLLRPEFGVINDGFRYTCHHCQRICDRLMVNLLNELNVPYIELKGPTEERLEKAKKWIDIVRLSDKIGNQGIGVVHYTVQDGLATC